MAFYCGHCKHTRGKHSFPLAGLEEVGPCKECDCGEYIASGRSVRPYMFPFVFMLGVFGMITWWSLSWFANPTIPEPPFEAPSIEYVALVACIIGTAIFARRMLRREKLE